MGLDCSCEICRLQPTLEQPLLGKPPASEAEETDQAVVGSPQRTIEALESRVLQRAVSKPVPARCSRASWAWHTGRGGGVGWAGLRAFVGLRLLQ